jgi:hypothetical protein
MPCYEPLCCNANRKPIPLFSLYNSLNFPDSIAINYCAPSQWRLNNSERGMCWSSGSSIGLPGL